MNKIINRLSWFCTLISLALIALISDELVDYILKKYQTDDIKNWWIK